MPNSILYKQIGRLNFLLSTLLVAVAGGGALHLMRSHAGSQHVLLGLEYGLVLLGVIWLRSLERRLLDAGLPRWYFWPCFLIVFTACFAAHVLRILDGPQTLALFIILQIPAALIPSKPASAVLLSPGGAQAGVPNAEYCKPVGALLFLLRVLQVAAFWVVLFQLEHRMGPGLAFWEMRLGLVLGGLVWIYNVEGRVLDAGLLRWFSVPYCLFLPAVCFLPVWFKVINLPLALALFVLLQIPTVFLRSQAMPAEFSSRSAGVEESVSGSSSRERKPIRETEPVGAFEFAVYLLLVAGLWAVLHLLRGDTGGGRGSWAWDFALDAGSGLLCLWWIANVKGRFKNLGLMRWQIDFCFIVLAICLLPFACRLIGFLQALVLFVLLQIPVVFIRRRWIPAGFFPANTDF